MSPRRVQDPEGAKTRLLGYKTAAEAKSTIIKRMFQITCYTKPDSGRLRVNPALTAGIIGGAQKILIYDAYVHQQSDLDLVNCGARTTP